MTPREDGFGVGMRGQVAKNASGFVRGSSIVYRMNRQAPLRARIPFHGGADAWMDGQSLRVLLGRRIRRGRSPRISQSGNAKIHPGRILRGF